VKERGGRSTTTLQILLEKRSLERDEDVVVAIVSS
jgi:hypothetical protein